MFIKSALILLPFLVVVLNAAAISSESEVAPLVEIGDYELVIGDYEPIPLRVLTRDRRQAKDKDQGRGSVGVDVQRGQQGTTVTADGKYNVYSSPNGRTTVDAHGQYQRNYGGPYGTSRPNYGAGVMFRHRF